MFKYRAILTTQRPTQRPVQAFFNSQAEANNWATIALAGRDPGDYVTIYRLAELPLELHMLEAPGAVTIHPWEVTR